MDATLSDLPTVAPRWAGFWIRFVADLIDTVILSAGAWLAQLILLGAVYWVGRWSGHFAASFEDAFNSLLLQVINSVIYLALAAPYYVIGHARYGTTLGKRVFKITVVDFRTLGPITFKQSWIRFLGYGPSYALFCVGFIMAALHPEKRALHDLLAGTAVKRSGPPFCMGLRHS